MWDKIKKAINSNLSKPLDALIWELYNSHKTDIVNTYNKSNEANINAWQSLQKGQEIVNIMNDTGGKRYTVTRTGYIDANSQKRFDYSGSSGILRKIEYRESRNSYGEHPPYIFLDGVQIDANKYDNCELEFKNSISIVGTNWPGNGNLGCFFVIQTEK